MPQLELIDIQRDLQRKIDKARPLMKQIECGDLKVLTDTQKNTAANYPQWVIELEEVKSGVMPKRFTEPKAKPQQNKGKHVDADANGGAAASLLGSNVAGVKSNKQLKREKQAQLRQKEKEVQEMDEEATFIHQLYKAPHKTRNALMDAHIATQIDKSQLQQLTKEFDEIASLRREILTGRLAKPTKVQEAKVEQADSIKKELQMEKDKVKLQSDRLKKMLIAQVEELEEKEQEATAAAKADESAARKRGGTAAAATESDEETEEPAAEDDEAAPAENDQEEATSAAPETEEEHDAAPEVEEVKEESPAKEEEPVADEEVKEEVVEEAVEETKPAPVAPPQDDMFGGAFDAFEEPAKEEEPAAAEEKVEDEPPKEEEPEPEPEKEEAPEPEEEERVPTPPPEPKKPIEYDWSEISIKKNRYRIPTKEERAAAEKSASDDTRSPSPVASPVKKDPYQYDIVSYDGTQTVPAPAAATSKSEKSAKGGKNAKKVSSPASPLANSAFSQTAVTRLQRDLALCKRNPIAGVNVCQPIQDNLFNWAINVTPCEGPLAGAIVPLECKFTELYPQQPPVLRCLAEIPHPSVVVLNGQRNVLCMPQLGLDADGNGWSPAYGVYAVLQHLANFFNDENFSRAKKAAQQGGNFKNTIQLAKAELSRIQTEQGHTTAAPVPSAYFVNGPLAYESGLKIEHGCLTKTQGKGSGVVSAAWRHSYSGNKTFTFAVEVCGKVAEDSLSIGVATDNKKPDETFTGFDAASGTVTVNGKVVEEGSSMPAVESGSTVFVTVDLTGEGKLSVGSETISLAKHDAKTTYHPTLLFGEGPNKTSAKLVCSTAAAVDLEQQLLLENANPADKDDVAATTVSAENESKLPPVTCFVSMGGEKDGLMGVGLHVTHNPKNMMPVDIEIAPEYISEASFKQLTSKKSPSGMPIECFLPVLLSAEHSKKALPALKQYVSRACRNPKAATAYEPPFRAAHAATVFPLALNGITTEFARNPTSGTASTVRLYTHLAQAFVTLASQNPDIVTECAKLAKTPTTTSGAIIAMSCVLEDLSWNQIATSAIRAELSSSTGVNASSSDEELFKKLTRPKRKLLLTAAAFARATNVFPLDRAVESYAESAGDPTPDAIAEIESAVLNQLSTVKNWDDLCNFLGVNISASDIFH